MRRIVANVLAWFPKSLDVFLAHGFTPLLNPILRRTVARATTIRQAASMHGVDLEHLLHDLNHHCTSSCGHCDHDDHDHHD